MKTTRVVPVGVAILFFGAHAAGQTPSATGSDVQKIKCDDRVHSTYLLGPDDQVEISAPELSEFGNKPVRIERQLEWGCIPLPGAVPDAYAQFTVAEVNLKKIMAAKDPSENMRILPHDVISVPKAEMVYVIGEVKRSGEFVLGEHQSISVLQALSLAEGLNGTADARHAKILRLKREADQREELLVDVKDLLKGKKQDVALQGDDILFIPGSTGKKAALRALEAAVQTGTGLAIWRTP